MVMMMTHIHASRLNRMAALVMFGDMSSSAYRHNNLTWFDSCYNCHILDALRTPSVLVLGNQPSMAVLQPAQTINAVMSFFLLGQSLKSYRGPFARLPNYAGEMPVGPHHIFTNYFIKSVCNLFSICTYCTKLRNKALYRYIAVNYYEQL